MMANLDSCVGTEICNAFIDRRSFGLFPGKQACSWKLVYMLKLLSPENWRIEIWMCISLELRHIVVRLYLYTGHCGYRTSDEGFIDLL